jgi:hypothetical protein
MRSGARKSYGNIMSNGKDTAGMKALGNPKDLLHMAQSISSGISGHVL